MATPAKKIEVHSAPETQPATPAAPVTQSVTPVSQQVEKKMRPQGVTKAAFVKQEKANMDAIVNRLGPNPTTSAKIRALYAAGYQMGDISEYTGKIFQHVRNVLNQKIKQPVLLPAANVPPAPNGEKK